ncbi:MAG: tetratricopeptide repeat protein [Spirulina sp.]
MAKLKKNLAKFTGSGFGQASLAQEIQRLEGLMRKEKWPEAMLLVDTLTQQFPQSKQVWQHLAVVSMELDDRISHQRAMEKLTALAPTNADYFFALGADCMVNIHPLLALQSFRQGVALNPNHEIAAEAQRIITSLEPMMEEALTEMGLTEADDLEIAVLHERSQACVERGDYEDARMAALAVLERQPNFLPAQNNLSLTFWAEGDVDSAIAQAQGVIDQQPDNIHALANLVRFYTLTQRPDQARPYADRMRVSHAAAWDGWTKKAEALTLLADDESLVALFEDFLAQGGDNLDETPAVDSDEANPEQEPDEAPMPRPSLMFYHWVAVALARTGKDNQAKALWKKILTHDPNLELAKTNLADLRRPVGQRHGAWPISWEQWLLPPTLNAFRQVIAPARQARQGQRLISGLEQFLDHHPNFVAMLPRIAERGGPVGQQFLVLTAEQVKHPGLLAVLKDFALGQNGSDELRYKAATLVAQARLIDKANVTLWLKGAWTTTTLIAFEIHDEKLYNHSKRVERWLGQAVSLMRQRTPAAAQQAEDLLQKAIAAEPEAPDLLNNLAAAYELRGRHQESNALIDQIHQRFPDYVMAAMAKAKRHMEEGDLDAAEAILNSFMAQDRFHLGEFSAFCDTQIDLLLAKNRPDGARQWLNIWEQTDPDSPRLTMAQLKLEAYSAKPRLEL